MVSPDKHFNQPQMTRPCVWGSVSNLHQSCRSLEVSTKPWAERSYRTRLWNWKEISCVFQPWNIICCIAVISLILYQFRAVVIVTVWEVYSLIMAVIHDGKSSALPCIRWPTSFIIVTVAIQTKNEDIFELCYLAHAHNLYEVWQHSTIHTWWYW